MKTLNRYPNNSLTLNAPLSCGNQMPSARQLPDATEMLVVIDPRVEDFPMLVAGAHKGANVLILDPTQDGVEQITEALADTSCTSLHLVCHGSPGSLELGKTPLSLDSLEQYNHLLQQWQVADILLYACNVAAGEKLGNAETFLNRLHQLTRANIAASAGRIGNAAKGGSWHLEHQLGQVSVQPAFLPELIQAYPGVFPVSFGAANNFGTGGNYATSVAMGDFNGDGNLDLTTANVSSNNVSVLLGNGNGTFDAATQFAVGSGPYSVAMGDFNGDGNLDLTTANRESSNVSVLLGNGNGTFDAATQFAVGSRPISVAMGDFNGDGNLDLTTATLSNNVSVLLGNGNGTFDAATPFAVGSSPRSVAMGDFNGDGNLDLTTANLGSNNVSVLLGNGNGTFDAATQFAVGSTPISVAVGDFNGDGNLDLTTANLGSGNVSVLLGNGNGIFFDAATPFAVGSRPFSVAVADFNGDGRPDLTTANGGSNNVSVLLNTTVFPVNDPPVNSVPGAQTTNEDTLLVFSSGNGNQISISDVDADNSPVEVTLSATNGVLTLDGTAGLAFSTGDGTNDPTTTFTGTISDINTALNGLRFAPDDNFNGDASLRIATNDQGNTGTGGAKSDTDTVNIAVNAVSDISINDVTVQEGNLGTTDATFTLTLDQASTETVTVDYATDDDTATAPSDYASENGTVTFNPGQTSQEITIEVQGDLVDEPDEAFKVNLSRPNNATIADGEGIGTIEDDDLAPPPPEPSLTISDAEVLEGDTGSTNASFTVTRAGNIAGSSSVNYTTTDGTATADSDYTPESNTLTFGAGEATKMITIAVQGDRIAEGNETFLVNLSDPDNATIADDEGEGTITDDDIANTQAGDDTNETFVTSPETDLIDARGGDDKVLSRFSELQQNDSIEGGLGRDTFVLNAGTATDSVSIQVNDPSDQLQGLNLAEVTNFEVFNLTQFAGTAEFIGGNQADSFFGGAGDDTITGNGGNDFLAGGGGVDDLFGGAGNDTYTVNSSNGQVDQVNEDPSSGLDSVRSSTSFTLSGNVENLLLLNNQAINGTGNGLNNTLIGNSAKNSLNGGALKDTLVGHAGSDTLAGDAGNDILTGSSGSDKFLYDSGRAFVTADVGVDNVTDFSGANAAGGDLIVLDKMTFTSLSSSDGGPLQTAEFASVTSDSLASGASAAIVYSRATDKLFYNQNGSDAGFGSGGSGGQFATLTGITNLAAADFLVQV